MLKRTKIIATLGPSIGDESMIRKIIEQGVDVCRINFSHGNRETQQKFIDIIHKINKTDQTHIALLADLQGPKIRVGAIDCGSVDLKTGCLVTLTTAQKMCSDELITIDYIQMPADVKPGHRILIDDGKIELKVKSTNQKDIIIAEVIHGGLVSSNKGINLPDTPVSQSSMTPKDYEDLGFILENSFQWVALSFVRNQEDILELKSAIEKSGKKKMPFIMAKIERPEAVKNIDSIIEVSDGIMVARGDLGIEIPIENVPVTQKMIVKKSLQAAKPIVIATQMMDSMISNYIPTRAEVNDVANSVMDGADALMLSGETSVGKYPLEVVAQMRKIIESVENYEDIFNNCQLPDETNSERYITDSICHNACILAGRIKATALVSMTHSGYTAIKLSSHRPASPIYAFTDNHSILSKLSLVWGVKGFFYDNFNSTDQTIEDLKNYLLNCNLVVPDDIILNLTSMPIRLKGKINTLKITRV